MILEHVFKVTKTQRIAKFDGLEPLQCEDIKEIAAPAIGLKKQVRTLEKQAPGRKLNPQPKEQITIVPLTQVQGQIGASGAY